MEAKDTVIDCVRDCEDAGTLECINCGYGAAFEQGCQAQAEVSFKAGYEQGMLNRVPSNYARKELRQSWKDGRKSGIKEAVEWFGDNGHFQDNKHDAELQAKLKEWNID